MSAADDLPESMAASSTTSGRVRAGAAAAAARVQPRAAAAAGQARPPTATRWNRSPSASRRVFLLVEVDPDDAVHLFFDAPAEAPTTRGFASILREGLDGLPAPEVLALPDDVPDRLGLAAAVSPLRLRGMAGMLARIKRQVREKQPAR